MSDLTCSADACEREVGRHGAKGFCSKHYQAYLAAGAAPDCSMDGCPKRSQSHGLCPMHYQRWRTRGDAGAAAMEREPNVGACEVPDCGQPMRKLTWCASHYAQQLRSGVVKPFSYKWGDGGYRPVHQWLNRTLGAAHTHSCSDCGKPAEEWSYQHNSADEIIDDLGRAYCKDPACYTPRCIPCHRRFDKARRLHVIP